MGLIDWPQRGSRQAKAACPASRPVALWAEIRQARVLLFFLASNTSLKDPSSFSPGNKLKRHIRSKVDRKHLVRSAYHLFGWIGLGGLNIGSRMPDSSKYVPTPGSDEYNKQLLLWDDDERPQQYAGIIICSIAATIAVILRLYAQRRYGKGWALDDLFIVVALVCRQILVERWLNIANWKQLVVLAELVASCQALKGGAGLHQIRVLQNDSSPPHGLSYIYTVGDLLLLTI